MKFLKLLSILLILFFNHHLFSQMSLTESSEEYVENLGLDLYWLSADFFVGYKEIRRRDFKNIIKQNPSVFRTYRTGVTLRTFGNFLGISSAVVLGTIYYPAAIGAVDKWILPTSVGTLAIGGIMYSIGRSKLRKSLVMYNQVNDFGFNMGVTENGVGVLLNF